jgi:hypothetical protein
LVLQLQATSEEGSKEEENALGVVLIALNLAVIGLALVQQPIFLKIASHIFAVARRIKERATSCSKRKDLDAAAADDDTVTGIEMQNNPSHADNRTDAAGEEPAATRIEIRANPLVSATRTDGLRADAGCIESEQLGGAEITQLRAEIDKLKRENEQLKQAQPGLARSPSKSVAPERRRRRSTGSARRRESGAEIEKSKLGRQRRRSTGRTNRTKEEEEAMLERREKRRQDRLRLRRYVGVLSLTVECDH